MTVIVTRPGAGGAGSTAKTVESFVVSNPLDFTFTLAATPVTGSVEVFFNGLRLHEGGTHDFTVSGAVVTIAAGHTLTVGDEFLFYYS